MMNDVVPSDLVLVFSVPSRKSTETETRIDETVLLLHMRDSDVSRLLK